MRLEFIYTADDFQEAFKAKWPKSARQRGVFRPIYIYLAALLVFIAFFTVNSFYEWTSPPMPMQGQPSPLITRIVESPLLFGVLIFGIIIWLSVRIHRRRGLTLWKNNFSAQQPQTVSIENDGIEIAVDLMSSRWKWETFSYWIETTNLFVLRFTNKSMLVIPKRAATDSQREEMRELFQSKINEPSRGFPVTLRPLDDATGINDTPTQQQLP